MADGSIEIETKLTKDELKKDINNLKSDFSKSFSSIESLSKKTMKVVVAGISTVTTALTGIGVAAVKSFADLEQNIGGIETLFKNSADAVIANANRAYKTAGMSANAYMSTVTSFSASLLQSLGGDTQKACEYADRAVIDMSDNANKMGTSMELIQNAYQGFAKQNYTMLDNLKLGYGGTKEEMQRLIEDASKLTDVQKELGVTVDGSSMSFGNIVNAISVMQKKMDIAGTTAKEAAETISGSISSMKASWDNFLNGSGDFTQVVESAKTAFNNIAKAASQLMPRIAKGIKDAIPSDVLPAISAIGVAFSSLSVVTNVAKKFEKFGGTVKKVQGFFSGFGGKATTAMTKIKTALDSTILKTATFGQLVKFDLVEGFNQAFPKISGVFSNIGNVVSKFGTKITNDFSKIKGKAITIFSEIGRESKWSIFRYIIKNKQFFISSNKCIIKYWRKNK